MLIGLFMWGFRAFILIPILEAYKIPLALSATLYGGYVFNIILAALYGYLINDWYDKDIDAINKPRRFFVNHHSSPIAIKTLLAILLIILSSLSVSLAFTTDNVQKLWILPTVIVCLWAYAKWLKQKKVLGNVLVSALIGLLVGMIYLAEWNAIFQLKSASIELFNRLMAWSFLYLLMIVAANYCREVIKDMEDVEGDRMHGVTSVVSAVGFKKTILLLQFVIMLIVAVEILQSTLVQSTIGTIIFTVAIAVLCLFIAYKLRTASEKTHYSSISKSLKWLMFLGILQMIYIEF